MSKSDDEGWKTIQAVVNSDNCTGCGMCARISTNVTMRLDDKGYNRPHIIDEKCYSGASRDTILEVCPGVIVRAAATPSDAKRHEVFGAYLQILEGWAQDPETRSRGSSGGVLTALAEFLIESGEVDRATVVTQQTGTTRTIPITATTPAEVRRSAGSRYCPVSAAENFGLSPNELQIGKPCEIAAVSALDQGAKATPVRMSFFCAGTPSQDATDKVVRAHFLAAQNPTVKYRGDGCPGTFRITGETGVVEMDYESSWSKVLGPTIQWRCKVCADGTGEYADLSVGDYWRSDLDGYPDLSSDVSDGTSVIVVRTQRGLQIVNEAVRLGVIYVRPALMARLEAAQPSQVRRRQTLAGRLIGARLAGKKTPKYQGYALLSDALRHPIRTVRAGLGTWRRVRHGATGSL